MTPAAPVSNTSLRRAACLLWLATFALALPARDFTVTVKQRDAAPLVGAVVLLEADAPTVPPAPPVRATMDQLNLAFEPDVLVIPVHSSVQFPNSDAVSHQVYSFSSARPFQLPLYRGRPYPPVTFEQPGVITLGCNIHDNMLAYIVVTRAPYFGRTDRQGRWSVSNLAAGRYRVRLWHPLLDERRDIDRLVGEAEEQVEIRLERRLRPAPLSNRPRSWDY
jgi:plastocyanin